MTKVAHGPGTPGGDPGEPFDWGASVAVPAVIDAGGNLSLDGAGATSVGTATDAQYQEVINGYLSAYPILVEIGKAAERFWRDGNCIELTTGESSRSVEPQEEIRIEVDAEGAFDHAAVKAPIVATFSGKEKLEPAGAPVDPPAAFDFTAGSEPGDKGTIELKQTSRRGIGLKTITYTVGSEDLLLKVSGTLNESSIGSNLTITLEPTTLKRVGGAYQGTALVHAAGSMFILDCSAPVNISGDATVIATPDEADSERIT
ncbi:MAG: hypothetical protein L0221_09595, partial [Chloroflexi bacterium]|nr:hypothetical protein [Chloroflexota bacterium]